ncbi:hypothetical protein CANINC_003693 [Pichia inconspicua]|uniref:SANT domain-containing protein n=1 Tax=Pichia inconspicua TaxID=52247 RepID=A0A4T0WZ55_9ASCO|nr:hypothetical protein CANINC_003693 [[Candida] inconspicua]
MAHDHHRNGGGGGGRYDTSKRPKKFYNQSHYNPYTSYSSNPNPFPSCAPQTSQQHDTNMHTSIHEPPRKLASHHFIRRTEQQGANSTGNNNWYSRSNQIYRTSRPSSANMGTSRKENYEDSSVRYPQYRNYGYNNSYQSTDNHSYVLAAEAYDSSKSRASSNQNEADFRPIVDSPSRTYVLDHEKSGINNESRGSDIDADVDAQYIPQIERPQSKNINIVQSEHFTKQLPVVTNDEESLVTQPSVKSAEPNAEKSFLSISKGKNIINDNRNETLKSTEFKEQTSQTDSLCLNIFSGIDACIFPMREVEYNYWVLKHQPRELIRKNLKYLSPIKLRSLSDYSFFDGLFLVFKQADAFILFKALKEMSSLQNLKKEKLRDEYFYRKYMWSKYCSFYDKQLEKLYETDTVIHKPTTENVLEPNSSPRTTTSRRSRHHGDSVRTEAEFLEILATLEKEREKDPFIKAQFGAAIIPDMMLDPIDRYALTRKIDSNNIVTDKEGWSKRLITDADDNFTEAEHARFCELYTLHPKKFGRISVELGTLRTPEECMSHYYRTKKSTNYKQLLINKSKRSKKKQAKRKKEKTIQDSAVSETSNQTLEALNGIESKGTNSEVETSLNVKREDSDDIDIASKQRKLSEDSRMRMPLENTEYEYVQPNVTDACSDNSHLENDEHKKSKRVKKVEEKPHISSYWSVQDINSFPLLLQKHGADWFKIADNLGTKSATMVKNYFQRGLIDHPEWQSFVNSIKSEDVTTLISSHDIAGVGPSVGYFYKPPASTSYVQPSTFNVMPPIMSTFTQKPPVQHQTSHFTPVTYSSQFYSQNLPCAYNSTQSPTAINATSDTTYQSSSHPIIQPPVQSLSQPRENMMNMPFILNTPTISSSVKSQQGLSAAYPPCTSDHSVSKHPNIMSLLNADDAPERQVYEPLKFAKPSSFKPNIQNIMNSSPVRPPKESLESTPGAVESSNPPSKSFTSGTSALDALARIAFERK